MITKLLKVSYIGIIKKKIIFKVLYERVCYFNLVFNFAFTPLQFGLKNNFLASVDILLVSGTLIWALVVLWYNSTELRWVLYANIPYLFWVLFATFLQLTITYLNK